MDSHTLSPNPVPHRHQWRPPNDLGWEVPPEKLGPKVDPGDMELEVLNIDDGVHPFSSLGKEEAKSVVRDLGSDAKRSGEIST